MAGHSKWANIRFRKAAQDAKRGKLFTKMIREITIAARGGDIDNNPRLANAREKALKAGMKLDTIQKAIQRGSGASDDADMFELRYEAYGPAGVAVIVDCLSDNKNRTVAEVRHTLSKYGGNLGSDGSVAYLFDKRGELYYATGVDEDALLECALEAGAEDLVSESDGGVTVLTLPEIFHTVQQALKGKGFAFEQADLVMRPKITIALDKEAAEKLLVLMDRLDDLDDVQEVYVNADMSAIESLEQP